VIEEDQDIKAEKTRTQQYLEQQERIREQELKEQLKKYEEENKKLKDSLNYNSHLNRISHMATSVKLKF
jgi:cell shape-determining protein MreC